MVISVELNEAISTFVERWEEYNFADLEDLQSEINNLKEVSDKHPELIDITAVDETE